MKKKFLVPLAILGFFASSSVGNNLMANAVHISNFDNKNDYNGIKTAQYIADEGTVLLKNDGFLPLKANQKLSIFGKSSSNLTKFAGAASDGDSINKYVNLHDSLTSQGFYVNPTLEDFYKNNSQSGKGRTNGNTGWTGISEVTIGETPIDNYSDSLKQSFLEYRDAAIFIISREGSEGCDIKTANCSDSEKNPSPISRKHALEMSDNERDLYNMIHDYFDHIIIILDSATCFECDLFEKDSKVSGILWTGGYSGNVGLTAIGRILRGKCSPSGRTIQTWARDFTKDPTFKNFSDNSQTNIVTGIDGVEKYVPQDTMYNITGQPIKSPGTLNSEISWADEVNRVPKYGLNGVRPSAFVKHEEDIYVDYRYYETVYEDKAVVDKAAADAWYDGEEGVVYPFGYGLSYTEFDKSIEKLTFDKNTNKVVVTVSVHNVGKVAGKEVVQLYWKAPYTPGGIEKASEVLCAFGKTEELEPGYKTYLDLTFNLKDIANYDAFDINNNDFKGYEVEKGTYYVSIRDNAHTKCKIKNSETQKNEEAIVIDSDIKLDRDYYSGNKVENRFTSEAFSFYNTLPTKNDFKFVKLTRDGGLNPSTIGDNSIEARTLKPESRIEEYLTHGFNIADVDVLHDYSYIPEEVYVSKQDAINKGFKQSKTTLPESDRTSAEQMRGVALDDPRWDSFLNEFTYSELCSLVTGHFSSPGIYSIGLKTGGETYRNYNSLLFQWPSAPTMAATWNIKLIEEFGECISDEANITKRNGFIVYANLRRSPFDGYSVNTFSADPLLTGKIVSSFVRISIKKGVTCYVGSLGITTQQKNREGGCVFASEQAIRELYLKGIQYVVQEGNATGVITSYQRLGLVDSSNNYMLLNDILRNEWGFKGVVLGEIAHTGNTGISFDHYENINYRVLAGLTDSLNMDTQGFKSLINCTWDETAFDGNGAPVFTYNEQTYESYSWWNALRNRAKERLYVGINYSDITVDNIVSSKDVKLLVNSSENYISGNGDNYIFFVGSSIDIAVNDNNGNAVNGFTVDPSTPLPKGFELSGSHITGVPTEPGTYRINLLMVNPDTNETIGKRFSMEIRKYRSEYVELSKDEKPPVENPPVDNSPTQEPEEEKGCGGSIGSQLPVMLLSLAGGIVLLAFRKKKQ